jgi:hypothetical protein
MKKLIFTLMMMAGLALVAGTAMGQTNSTPYQGSSYEYTVNQIGLQSVGTGRIILNSNESGLTPDLDITGNWSVTSATNQVPTNLNPAAVGGNSYGIDVPAATTEITFSIDYNNNIPTGDYDLYLEVTQTSGGCSNFIRLDITVQTPPSLDIALTTTEDPQICQTVNPNPGTMANNTAGSVGQTTTWTYTVTPDDLTNIDNYSFTFVLDNYTLGSNSITVSSGDATLDTNTGSIAVSNASGTVVFTASVTTTTNQAALPVQATISDCEFQLLSTAGGGTYSGTESDDTETVTISTMPAIGGFN